MKLYDANAGNAKRVRIFIEEKGIEVPRQTVELGKDTRAPWFRNLNSLGEVPVLVLDDGHVITESNAICRYLDIAFPQNPLMGTHAQEQGHIEMWSQRIYQQIFLTVGLMVRHTLPLFEEVIEQVPAFAATQRRAMPDRWKWLDQEMSDGRPFIAGDNFTFADVQGMTALTIADIFDLGVPEDCAYVGKWANGMRARPSWNA
ncbi:glutathione S-transferase family protein [Exilibacterium tricleocarpae]|uniref:Glutathione S-transferase family protein n=1 Tax=Exilibacterium tricleocarpae TaxID=2591008 RepID=A0A545T021_9GAMM|nr:glutathione S-transferase family protein [Exilibacterium tricleocarpae]TQV70565.1 glutathione S-transferase family protein [Exilibacterium tricleocarpae]